MTDEEALDAQLAEIDARIAELEEEVKEYEAMRFITELFYWRDEGIIDIEEDRVFFLESPCFVN